MENIINFLWDHPSLAAILFYVIMYAVLWLRAGRRNIDQAKDTLYGSSQGYTGRKLERNWKNEKAGNLAAAGFVVLLIFLGYRFLKTIHWI